MDTITFGDVKKLLTLCLLALFIFNMVGYYGVMVGLQLRSEQSLRMQFDAENYALDQEITIKVPIAIPYATDSKGYERVDGEFLHKGQVYRLVKQKLQNDTLLIVCMKDNQAVKINQALTDYVKTFTDKPFTTKQNTKANQVFSKDYISIVVSVEKSVAGWILSSVDELEKPNFYFFNFNSYISQPPEA